MRKTKNKHKLSTVIRVLFSVSLMVLVLGVGNTVLGDGLATATGVGSTTTTDAGTYVNAASATLSIGSNNSDVTKVMVVCSFEVKTASPTSTNDRTATFRIADVNNSNYSTTISRRLEKEKNGDKGIGTMVYIFDVSGYNTSIEYQLQHTTSNSSYDNITSGTIVAVALGTTTNHYQLNNDVKSITTGVTVGDNDYITVTGLETDAVSLPVSGAIYVAASINNLKTTGGVQACYWRVQYKKGSNGIWTNYGYEISRTISSNDDEGIASIGYVVTDLPKDDYYFRLQHKGPSSPTAKTLNTNLIAVALSYNDASNGGRRFPAFNSQSSSATTTSTSLTPALSVPGAPASNCAQFMYAQYNMSASDELDSPSFDIYVSGDASYTYSSQTQQRRLSSSSDLGAGGSVGMAENLIASNSYTGSIRHMTPDGGITLTTSNLILSGFQTTDIAATGYWIGGASGNETQWNNTANWADGIIPVLSTNVTIYSKTNEPVIAASATCNTLNILNDATLTVNTGQTLTITDSLIIESGGSFISEGTTTASGVKATRQVAASIWHYISSPVNGQVIGDFITDNDVYSPNSGTNYSFYRWDEPTNYWYIFGDGSFGDANFVNGRGYAATFATERYIEYTGSLNTGDQTITVYKTVTSGREGSNLLGNPFLAPIDLALFTNSTNNPNIEGTVYFWSEQVGWLYDQDNYAYWNGAGAIGAGTQIPSDQIGVAQGFMVQATDNNVPVNFDLDMRTHANPNYFKQSEISSIKLSIQYQDDYYNETLIAMLEEATLGFDRDYDGRKLLGDANLYLYTEMPETNQQLAIQGIPFPEDSPIELPLIVETGVSGEFTLQVVDILNIDAAIDVLLEDKQNDQIYDLKKVDQITIELDEGICDSRFSLHFNNTLGIEDEEYQTKSIYAYATNNTLHIINPENKTGIITIYNLAGQEIATFKLTGDTKQQQTLNVSDIINIVQIKTDNEVISKKVIFK